LKAGPRVIYSKSRVAARVAAMGRTISRDYARQDLDVVILVENAFIFGADLVRSIALPVACHFVRAELRDIEMSGYARREVFFSQAPALKGRNVLLVDALLRTGVTLDFLAKRLQETLPRSLRIAVLIDAPSERRVDLGPDYFGFVGASNQLVGYGLADRQGHYRNLGFVGSLKDSSSRRGARGGKDTGARRRASGSR
jgi:hypoxanthine phosphoribosyltransferase